MIQKIINFIDKWDGKIVDYDGVYKYQCKDYTNQFTKEVFGIESPKGNAEDVWNKNWGSKFEKHKNTPSFLPLLGDICIWNGKHVKYGHIGIVVSADLKNMVISDQNSGTGNGNGQGNNKIRKHKYNYKNVIGFIRYKQNNSMVLGETKTENGYTFPSSIYGIPIQLGKPNDPKKPAGRYNDKEKIIYLFPEFLDLKPEPHVLMKVILHEFSHFLQKNYYDLSDIDIIKFLFNNNSGSFSDYSLTNWNEYVSEYIGYGQTFILEKKELPKGMQWKERDDIVFKYLKTMNDFALYKFLNK